MLFLVVALTPAVVSACGTIQAGYLLQDALRSPDALAGETREWTETVETHGQAVPVRMYAAKDEEGPGPAIVLVAGAVVAGADDPRLVALARAIAVRGAVVATPDLPSLKGMTLDPLDPARVAAVGGWLAGRADLAEDGRVSYAGICVGASYCLIAAADPDRPRPRTVISLGAYSDFERLLRGWLVDGRRDAPGLLDPMTEGRRLVLAGNLDPLVPEEDRELVARILRALLDGRPPPDETPATEMGRLVAEVARREAPVPPAEAERLMEPMRGILARLSPSSVRPRIAAPVYLVHGETDPVVPPDESRELYEHLKADGVRVELLVTDVFRHADAGESPGLFEAWPLLSLLADAFAAAGL